MNDTTRVCKKCLQPQAIAELTKVNSRWYCTAGCSRTGEKATIAAPLAKAVGGKLEPALKPNPIHRYVITAAQNNTPINASLLSSLEAYCDYNDAHLVVIPYRYRNPTTPDEANSDEWWDERIAKYLVDRRFGFRYVNVLADIKINPTAVNPLSGLEALAAGKSAIVAHPQIALKCIPTPMGELPLILTTTGAVTNKNYSDSKAGKKGEFHHSFGAVVLERKDTQFFIRHLHAKEEGSFIDLGVEYKESDRRFAQTEALVMGDLHIGQSCPKTLLGTSKLIKQLKPKAIVLHDAFDGESVNPHETSNPFAKFSRRFNSLEDELATNAKVLKHFSTLCQELVIVNSNHNEFLTRFLKREDWRYLQPTEAKLYLRMASAFADDLNADVYAKEMTRRGVDAVFLALDESYKVKDIELGHHGHLGSNGSRGSSLQYARTGSKTIIAHSHSPNIVRGCFQVGTSTHLKLGYTKGLSSWNNTHCLIYDNGKRQLVTFVDGSYTI